MGWQTGALPEGIAPELEQPRGASRPRGRYLSGRRDQEPSLRALDAAGACWRLCRLSPLAVLDFLRLDEAVGATFGEIDAGLWLNPSLTGPEERPRSHDSPSPPSDGFTPGSGSLAPAQLLFRTAAAEGWRTGRSIIDGLLAVTSTSGWHRHDIRRTVATDLGDMGVAPHVIEVVLGHAVPPHPSPR